MLRSIIVEDEKNNRETLKSMLLEFCPGVEVMGMAASVPEARDMIHRLKPELIFLDIELQTGSGFELLEPAGSVDFDVIFTTAYEQYAIKAIKLSSLDYLLKPIDIEELQQAVEKAIQKKHTHTHSDQIEVLLSHLKTKPAPPRKICLATSEGLEYIATQDIILCEANGSYTTFYVKDGIRIMVSKNLKEYESLLEGLDFMRVHNSYLINLREVKKFIKADGGSIIMQNGHQVSISPKKRQLFMDAMGALM
jgi:two-component system, LytTR family, response regulator